MIEVAKATVTIIPNMQGAQQAITNGLTGMSNAAGSQAGNLAGAKFMGGMGAKLSSMGSLMAKLLPAAAVAAAGAALFKVGEEFDEMTDTIIVGTGASGQALEGLRQSAMDIATTVPVSFGEAGDLVQDLNTRLGLTGDTLTEVGTQIAQVGEMTGESFDTESFAGAMSVWGTAAEDMSGQLDTLFAVSQSTGIGMNELTGITESAGPSMQALGYSFEETAAMAGLLDKAGLDANGTMSKMSKALTTLAKDGEEPAEAMTRVTEEIGNYIEQGDEAAAISAASELFGTRGATQFVAAVQSGSMSVEEFAESMSNSDGIIGETQEKTMDFSEHVELLKNQFKALLEPMGSAVFAGLSSVMGVLSNQFGKFVSGPGKRIGAVFKQITSFAKSLGKQIAAAFKDTAGIKSFGSATKSVGGAVKSLLSALRPVFNVMRSLLKTVLPPLARIVGIVLGNAFKTLKGAIEVATVAVNKIKSVINSVKSAFNSFKSAITAPFRFLSGLKIPRISVSGGTPPFGIGGLGTKPSIKVTWAAKGGVINGPLIGAGEAGKEALLPLERDTSWADIVAKKVNAGNTFNVTMNVNGAEDPEQWADRFMSRLQMEARMA